MRDTPDQLLIHLGDNFFRVTENLDDLQHTDPDEVVCLIGGVVGATSIRGAQFLCGRMIFKGDDATIATVVADDEAARVHGIHSIEGPLGYVTVTLCPHRTHEQREAAMAFMVDGIKKLRASRDAFMKNLSQTATAS